MCPGIQRRVQFFDKLASSSPKRPAVSSSKKPTKRHAPAQKRNEEKMFHDDSELEQLYQSMSASPKKRPTSPTKWQAKRQAPAGLKGLRGWQKSPIRSPTRIRNLTAHLRSPSPSSAPDIPSGDSSNNLQVSEVGPIDQTNSSYPYKLPLRIKSVKKVGLFYKSKSLVEVVKSSSRIK